MTANSVFTASYIFYTVAVVLAVVIYSRYRGKILAEKPAIDVHAVHHLSPVDLIGAGLLVLFYAIPLSMGGEQETVEITPLILGVGILTQLFPAMIAIIILAARGKNLITYFNLKWKEPYYMIVIAPMGVVFTLMFTWILQLNGYEAWILKVFGDDANPQEIVQTYQETNQVLIRVMIAFMVIVIAPIVEEIVFRGYIYPVTKQFTGRFFAMLMTSFLFGIVHFNIAAVIPLIFLAFLLTIAYEFTKSIWAPISIHALFNACTVFFMEFQKFEGSNL